ncbi:MAG: hypothetical protein ABSB18_07860 [Candidatus Omnitrophota bacterium]
MRRKKTGQSLTEIALLVATIAAALTGMSLYLQRSLQQRYRQGAGFVFYSIIGCVSDPANLSKQYEPYYHESSIQEEHRANETSGWPNRTRNATINQTGWDYTSVNVTNY